MYVTGIFLSKKDFVKKKQNVYILKKMIGGGGEAGLRMWWDFSGELVTSSNPCSF